MTREIVVEYEGIEVTVIFSRESYGEDADGNRGIWIWEFQEFSENVPKQLEERFIELAREQLNE